MKTIWKFPLEAKSKQTIQMPKGAEILTAQMQGNAPFIWALVDDAQPMEPRKIFVAATGLSAEHVGNVKMNVRARHIGTFQADGLVYHVFG